MELGELRLSLHLCIMHEEARNIMSTQTINYSCPSTPTRTYGALYFDVITPRKHGARGLAITQGPGIQGKVCCRIVIQVGSNLS